MEILCRSILVRQELLLHQRFAGLPQGDASGMDVRCSAAILLNWIALHDGEEDGMNQKLLDEINEKMKAVLAQGPAVDIEKNMRAMLSGLFSRLDLVTREEFDVQREVLLRTRAKLAELEKTVAELEADTANHP